MNRFVWNLRYPDAEGFPGMIIWGSLTGPRAIPGTYQARIKFGDQQQTVSFEVKPDPRSSATAADMEAQFNFLRAVRDKLTETHTGIKQIRDVREQITGLDKRLKDKEDVSTIVEAAKVIEKKLTSIEETLYQTKAKSSQDVLNFPIRLNNKLASLAGLVGAGDAKPTDQALQVKEELTKQIDTELSSLRQVMSEDLARLNDMLNQKKIPNVFSDTGEKKPK
jgi:ferritin-like metal-binding protein YciE